MRFVMSFRDGAADVMSGLKESIQEMADEFIGTESATDAIVEAKTPSDRWFQPAHGWPLSPAPLPSATSENDMKDWQPPPLLCPTAIDEPFLFSGQHEREEIGKLYVEVLEAQGLPNSLLQAGSVDPYVIIVYEGNAARTNQVRNTTSPRWGVDTPRAFQFRVTCPYSALHVALLDEDRMGSDDTLGRVVIDVSQLYSRTTCELRGSHPQ